MIFSKLLATAVRKALVWSANRIAVVARKNASWSTTIPKAISVGTVEGDENRMSITISVDEKIAPHAMAFEKGSGIHGEKGKTYVIKPRNVGALAFDWKGGPEASELWGSNKFLGVGRGGKLLFKFVDHPGVEARPFLAPALNNSISAILNRFSGAAVEALDDSLGVKVEIIR